MAPEPQHSRTGFPPPDKIFPRLVAPALLAAAILLGVLAWLDAGKFQVMVGDDLRGFFTANQGLKPYYDLLVAVLRFRPIAAAFMWAAAKLSSGQFQQLLLIGAALHTLNALLFWGLLRRLLHVTPGLALCLTLVATFNRFMAYFLTPELAIIEGTAITFYLLFLGALVRLLANPRQSVATLTGGLFFIILHIHERYMVLVSGAVVAAILIYRQNRRASLVTAAVSFLALSFNFGFKKFFLATPIFMGTTTQPIEFNPKQIISFFENGLVNLLGINRGPSYLSIYDYLESPGWLKLVSLASAALALVVLVIGCFRLLQAREKSAVTGTTSWRTALVLLVLVLALVLSASITFRQEYRWLYPAYLTFLALLGLMCRSWSESPNIPRSRLIGAGSLAAFCLLAIPREVAIREHRDNYYARSAYRTGNDLYFMLEHSPGLRNSERVLIGGTVPDFAWVFMGDLFSRNYKLPAPDLVGVPPGGSSTASEIFFIKYDQALREFTFVPSDDTKNNLEDLITGAVVSPDLGALSTPNGKAAFALSNPALTGWGMASPITVDIPVRESNHALNLSFSAVWAQGDGLNLTLTAYLADSTTAELITANVLPLHDNARPNWRTYRVKVPENCQRLRLSLHSDSGDRTADWLCFRNFSFE